MAKNGSTRKKWLFRVLELALLVVVIAGIQAWRSQGVATGAAPHLNAPLVDGRNFDLSSSQRPVVVHFWATWCPVCRLGQGSIDSLAREGRVVTVALSSGTDQEIRGHLREAGISFPVVNDDAGTIADRWGVSGVPASFIVDQDGQIRFVATGYTTAAGLRTRLWLAESGS